MRIDFGYLRCSTQEQHLDRQFEAIRRFRDIPEEYLFAEKVTGKTDNREQYQAMKVLIQRLVDINARKSEEQRDTIEVVIEELDRLGRTKKIIRDEMPISASTHLVTSHFLPLAVAVQSLSHVQLFVTPWMQHTRLLCPPLSSRVC